MKKIILLTFTLFLVIQSSLAQEHKEYHENGKLKKTGQFDSNGNPTGIWKYFNTDGSLKNKAFYFNNKNHYTIDIKSSTLKESDMTWVQTSSSSEKAVFKVLIKNSLESNIELTDFRFRCYGKEACGLNESIKGKIIKPNSEKFVEVYYTKIDGKPGISMLQFLYKGQKYSKGFSLRKM